LVHKVVVSIVLLQASFGPDVPEADGAVFTGGSDAGAIGVETHTLDCAIVVFVAGDHFFVGYIPQLYEAVFRARADESGVGAELHGVYPVVVRINTEHVLAVVHLVNFQGLVVRARNYQGSICRKTNCFYWGEMALNNCAESFNRVFPDTNSLISRARNDSVTIGC